MFLYRTNTIPFGPPLRQTSWRGMASPQATRSASSVAFPTLARTTQDTFHSRFQTHSLQFNGKKTGNPSKYSLLMTALAASALLHRDVVASENDLVPVSQEPVIYNPGNHWTTPNAALGGYTDWPANVEVLASSSQRHFSRRLIGSRMGLYTTSLLETITLPSITSLTEAHGILENSGYRTHPDYAIQVPVSTFNANSMDHQRTCQTRWAKDTPYGVARFALLIGNGEDFSHNLSGMEQMLQSIYGLSDEQIRRHDDATTQEFTQGMQQLAKNVKTAKQYGLTPEILIYYTGHGGIQPGHGDVLYTPSFKEGAAKGAIDLADGTLNEDIVKMKVRHYLPKVNTLLILDTCQAGSWAG